LIACINGVQRSNNRSKQGFKKRTVKKYAIFTAQNGWPRAKQ